MLYFLLESSRDDCSDLPLFPSILPIKAVSVSRRYGLTQPLVGWCCCTQGVETPIPRASRYQAHLLRLFPLKSPSRSHFSPFLSAFLSLLLSCRGLPYFFLASYITVSLRSHARYGRPLYRMKAFSLYLSFYLIGPTLLFFPPHLLMFAPAPVLPPGGSLTSQQRHILFRHVFSLL